MYDNHLWYDLFCDNNHIENDKEIEDIEMESLSLLFYFFDFFLEELLDTKFVNVDTGMMNFLVFDKRWLLNSLQRYS